MKTKKLEEFELDQILKDVNAVKLRLAYHDHWMVFPLLNSDGETLDIVAKKNSKNYFSNDMENVLIKFKKDNYEYLLAGTVISKDNNTSLVTIEIQNSIAYHNYCKEVRLNADFEVKIIGSEGKIATGQVKDISKGGAKIIADINEGVSEDLEIEIQLNETSNFKARAKILSKKERNQDLFEYGLKFIQLKNSDKTRLFKFVNTQESDVNLIVNDYRVNINVSGKKEAQIALLSYNLPDSLDLADLLKKMGYNDYFIVANYGALRTSMLEEMPILVIIDGRTSGVETIYSVITRLRNDFGDIEILALIPDEYENLEQQLSETIYPDANIIYYPLIVGEFEQILLKYI